MVYLVYFALNWVGRVDLNELDANCGFGDAALPWLAHAERLWGKAQRIYVGPHKFWTIPSERALGGSWERCWAKAQRIYGSHQETNRNKHSKPSQEVTNRPCTARSWAQLPGRQVNSGPFLSPPQQTKTVGPHKGQDLLAPGAQW